MRSSNPRHQTARFRLREATSAAHDRVDSLFSMTNFASREDYGRFLIAQAEAFLPVERSLETGGIAEVLRDWPERRRSDLLVADLEGLGLPPPNAQEAPRLTGAAALLGGAYVLEGSRLGGAMLRKAVPTGLPASFLSASDPGAWRELVELLDDYLTTEAAMREAVTAAESVFALFERSAQQMSFERNTPVA